MSRSSAAPQKVEKKSVWMLNWPVCCPSMLPPPPKCFGTSWKIKRPTSVDYLKSRIVQGWGKKKIKICVANYSLCFGKSVIKSRASATARWTRPCPDHPETLVFNDTQLKSESRPILILEHPKGRAGNELFLTPVRFKGIWLNKSKKRL